MSSGDARRSQLTISFDVVKKQWETLTQRSTKRLREDTEHLTPEILISNSSTSTIIQEEDNINSKEVLSTEALPQNHNADGLALKINYLKEKSPRYNSHRDFLSKCIQQNFVPKGLEITLELTIESFDQDFFDNWYTNIKQLSIVLMKQIVAIQNRKHKKH